MGRKEINGEELKKIELDILSAVHDFCEEHNLRYYLYAGTLLGAVRHDGFIPWDDDVDVAMPRSDFEVFLKTFSSDDYAVSTCETDPDHPFWHAKVYHKHSIKEETIYYKNPPSLGVDIDIFLLDSCHDFNEVMKTAGWRSNLARNYWLSLSPYKNASLKRKAIGVVARNIFGMNANKTARAVNKKVLEFGRDGQGLMDYADCTVKEPIQYEREWFADRVLHKFEDKMFYIPAGYDQVLTVYYGDYMTPPPEAQRVTHHGFVAYYK